MQDPHNGTHRTSEFGKWTGTVNGIESIFSERFANNPEIRNDPVRRITYYRDWTESDLRDMTRRQPEFFEDLGAMVAEADRGDRQAQRALQDILPKAFCTVDQFSDAIYRVARNAGYPVGERPNANVPYRVDPNAPSLFNDGGMASLPPSAAPDQQQLLRQLDGARNDSIRLASLDGVTVPNLDNAIKAVREAVTGKAA